MALVETWGPVPLNAQEIERACAIVRESADVPDGVRFVWAAVAEGTKGAEPACAPGRGARRTTGRRARRTASTSTSTRARSSPTPCATTCSRRSSTRSTRWPARSCAPTPAGARRWRNAASPTSTTSRSTRGRPATSGWRGRRGGASCAPCPCGATSPDDNGYAHPIEGVIAFVDLNERRIVRLEDHGVVPVPTDSGRYDAESNRPWRETLRPLEIVQPEGPSFTRRRQRHQLGLLAPRGDHAPGRRTRAARSNTLVYLTRRLAPGRCGTPNSPAAGWLAAPRSLEILRPHSPRVCQPELAALTLAELQVPGGVEALAGAVQKPAWRVNPSWYLVATDDEVDTPPAQRSMAQRAESKVVETAGHHCVLRVKAKGCGCSHCAGGSRSRVSRLWRGGGGLDVTWSRLAP